MKYKIIRSFIVYENGMKDTMENEFETDNLEDERKRLSEEFNCKYVYFTFSENKEPPQIIPIQIPIDQIVSEAFEVSIDWMTTRSKKRIGVEARQMAMWWREKNTSDSLADIGKMYGDRDHATVLYAVKTVNNLKETNKVFKAKFDKALLMIEQFNL